MRLKFFIGAGLAAAGVILIAAGFFVATEQATIAGAIALALSFLSFASWLEAGDRGTPDTK